MSAYVGNPPLVIAGAVLFLIVCVSGPVSRWWARRNEAHWRAERDGVS